MLKLTLVFFAVPVALAAMEVTLVLCEWLSGRPEVIV